MAKLKLLSTIFSKLGSLTKNNGQIIVTRDSKSLYIELEGERIEITDWIDIDTEESLLAILSPLTNKYYYTKDSNKIWRYIGGEWICLNNNINDQSPTYTESTSLVKLSSGEKLSIAFGKISKAITDLISHISDTIKHITADERTSWNNKYAKPSGGIPKSDLDSAVQISLGKADTALQTHQDISGLATKTELNNHTSDKSNPHGVTKSQVGLGNCDDTSDEDKPISTAQQEEFDKIKSDINQVSDKVTNAVNTALAQAKASGEFDGADGKSAYQYAQDGGYTGTEAEFAEKLAQEQLTGTTGNLMPTQVYNAVSAGVPVKVQYFDGTYGALSFTAFNVAESLNVIASNVIAYYNGVYMLCELYGEKSSNRWGFNVITLAQKTDIPSALPNPNALTIKIGDTTVTYDGSTAQTVTIADGTEVSY